MFSHHITDPPTVKTLSQQNIIEGINVSITCQANVGNPSPTAMYWIKVDDAGFRQNGPTLHLLDIQRTSSGTYKCTAENNYGNGEKGRNSQSMIINVLCKIAFICLLFDLCYSSNINVCNIYFIVYTSIIFFNIKS